MSNICNIRRQLGWRDGGLALAFSLVPPYFALRDSYDTCRCPTDSTGEVGGT
jgi:hypothetical protein